MNKLTAFWLGFKEGRGDTGRTWENRTLNEWYDWGRSLRRLSRKD